MGRRNFFIMLLIFCILILNITCKKEKQITIRAAMFKSPATDATLKLLPEFERETGIKVIFDIYPYIALREKILTEFLGRTGTYDLVMADCIWIPEFAAAGYLKPIEEYMKDSTLFNAKEFNYKDIIPTVADYLGRYPKGGTLYGFPFMTNTPVLAYRKDLYEKYVKPHGIRPPGKTVKDAWTWEEYLNAAKLLTKDFNDDGKIDLWGSTLQAKRGNSVVYEWYTYLYSFGGCDFDYSNFEVKLDTPESIKSIEFYINLYRKYKVAPPSVVSWAHDEEAQAMTQGLCAMDATWNMENAYTLINPATSPIHDKIDFAMTPKFLGRNPTPDMGGYGLLITRDSRNPRAAFKFLTWIASPKIHKKIVLAGGTPFRYSEMKDLEILAKYPFYEIYDDALEVSIYRARVPEWSRIEEIIAIELSQAMIGDKTPEEAAKSMKEKVYKVMKESGYYR
jgi:ABC-type glycerol-3-phosphate transport system substrate-binding protein